ncbi:hypothetical protein [Motilibacter deserti]|uniref:Integral membrane protein n=1 Tax=Motilibacter deserti TaxID=2714956 RepID=A0ABX0GVW5_9ACTN|nr:hypothetical protein [Motilibacter deserti]NHC15071.1 hypothetical protein [Motilibacter deserti]
MLVAAIVACEVGFWVVLAAGLLLRYALRLRTAGAAVLAAVPLVDLALLAFTVADLRRGAEPEEAHGLAAVYLGVSVAFGHAMVRWADVRVAHRFAGGPAPVPRPASGTPERVRKEWRDFGLACVAAGVSAVLLLGAAALAESGGGSLLEWLPRLGLVLTVWLVGWPVWETLKLVTTDEARAARR